MFWGLHLIDPSSIEHKCLLDSLSNAFDRQLHVNVYEKLNFITYDKLRKNFGFLSVKCNFDRLSNHFGFCPCVYVYVCPPIGCWTITSAILYQFSPNFASRSEMWLFRTLLFLGQTGSTLPILEMCKIRFWQFRDCGGHIFPRIVTKTWIKI